LNYLLKYKLQIILTKCKLFRKNIHCSFLLKLYRTSIIEDNWLVVPHQYKNWCYYNYYGTQYMWKLNVMLNPWNKLISTFYYNLYPSTCIVIYCTFSIIISIIFITLLILIVKITIKL